jgi:hypothetical protein
MANDVTTGAAMDFSILSRSMADGINPFGEPDGSRQDFTEVNRGFVDFKDPTAWGGLATQPDDLSARILIGRKGSGKTLYLRRLRDWASRKADLYTAREEQSPPDSTLVVQFAYRCRGRVLSEVWSLAWNRAILRALTSQLLSVSQLRDHLPSDLRDRLASYKDIR